MNWNRKIVSSVLWRRCHFCRKSSDRMSEKQSDGDCGTFVGRVPTGCLRSHKNRWQSKGEGDTFVGRIPTGCRRRRENRLQQCTFVGRVPTGCLRSHNRCQSEGERWRRWHFCRKSSDKMSERWEEKTTVRERR